MDWIRPNHALLTPVVVLWGAARRDMPDQVAGDRLLQWLTELDDQPVDRAAASDVVKRLEGFRASAWDRVTRVAG